MTDNLARDAERIVLGAMMLDPTVIDAVTAKLRSGDFADPRHGSIFAAIVAQYASDGDTGPAAVAIVLHGTGELGKVGGAPELHDLIASVPTAANATWYAGVVADAALARAVVVDAIRLRQVAETGDAAAIEAERGRLVDQWTADDARTETDSWAPLDLGPYVRGEAQEQPPPSVGMRRRDGLRLLYPGKEHAVIGEMESGKTWFAVACVAAEIEAGNHVVNVHFEEPDPSDMFGRLRALGVSATLIEKCLRFVAPTEPVSGPKLARLLDPPPTLVVFDGINEGMSLHRWGIREEDGAAMFRRHLIAPCLRVGAATLGCDHVIKDVERRGRYALGSIHKGNGITGSLILLENAEPFGRGERGRSHVFITKDRPGHLRQHGRPDDRTSGKTFMGELVVDDSQTTSPELELIFWPPKKIEVTRAPEASPMVVLEHLVLQAVREITAKGKVANKAAIRAMVSCRATDVDRVLTLLVLDDRLVEAPGRGTERRYTIPSPSGDQLSNAVPSAPETRPESAVLQRDGRTDSWDGPLAPVRTDPDGLGRDQQQATQEHDEEEIPPGRVPLTLWSHSSGYRRETAACIVCDAVTDLLHADYRLPLCAACESPIQVWTWDRLVAPRAGKRRVREQVKAMHWPLGWWTTGGNILNRPPDHPIQQWSSQEVCASIMSYGDTAAAFRADHEGVPTVWAVEVKRGRRAGRRYSCDAHLHAEDRPAVTP